MQDFLVEEGLLLLWHEQRMACPRENSAIGFRRALGLYQQRVAYEQDANYIDKNALGNAYEAYAAMLEEEVQQILKLADPNAPPFPPCAACHAHIRRLTFDCTFKCKHLKRCSRDHEHFDSVRRGLIWDYPHFEPYVEKRADGERKSDCSSQYVVDNDCAKASSIYDYQGQGLLLCPHYHIIGVSAAFSLVRARVSRCISAAVSCSRSSCSVWLCSTRRILSPPLPMGFYSRTHTQQRRTCLQRE